MDSQTTFSIENSKINYHFCGTGIDRKKEWWVLDDRIIYQKKTFFTDDEAVYMLENIQFYKYIPSIAAIQFIVNGDDAVTLTAGEDSEDLRNAANYIKDNCGISKIMKALNELEWIIRCDVCDNIFCYTFSDLAKNIRFAQVANNCSKQALVNVFVGTQIGMYENIKLGNSALGCIADYSKCPKCNSTKLTEITKEEWETAKRNKNLPIKQSITSSADELKKFKELLDMGAITQEEFDAKKKELLGL